MMISIKFSKKNERFRYHQGQYKNWLKNMNNRNLDYLHIGEDFHMRTIHMNHKCSIDRIGVYPHIHIW